MSEKETQIETEEEASVEEEVEETIEEVEDTVEETVEEVEETVEEAFDEVEQTVEEGLEVVNDGVIEVVSAVLDTRARADVYVALRNLGEADIDELVEETGLYPSKVEDTLKDLSEDDVVEIVKVDGGEVYTAASPLDVVTNFPERLADSVRGFVESVEEEVEEGLEDNEVGDRILNANWSPYRIIMGTDEEKSEEAEIVVQ